MLFSELALRVFPAVTMLTVYCWLYLPAQPIGSGNMAHNWWACFCAQTLIARDSVITSERRSILTKTYGQRNFLANRRCHCYTTERVVTRPSQNCHTMFIFLEFWVCWLAFKGSPAETRLTVYCWLLIITRKATTALCFGRRVIPLNASSLSFTL